MKIQFQADADLDPDIGLPGCDGKLRQRSTHRDVRAANAEGEATDAKERIHRLGARGVTEADDAAGSAARPGRACGLTEAEDRLFRTEREACHFRLHVGFLSFFFRLIHGDSFIQRDRRSRRCRTTTRR